jgi:cytochrome c-type biogenesis protein CcmH/NrfG
VQATIETARILAARGEIDAAESRLRNLSEVQPADPSVLEELGKLLLDADRTAEAADAYRGAQRIDPSSASAVLGLAEALRRCGDPKGAREVLVAARAHNPKDAEIVSAVADIDAALGDSERALEWRRLVVELDPEDVSGWNNLGAALASADSYGDAAACFLKAHELAPDRLEITANLGVALVAAGRPYEGLPYLEQVLPHMPDNVFGAMALAQALELTGRADEALAAWRRLAVAEPMAALEVARLELERGRRRAAEAALADALARGGAEVRQRLENDPVLRALHRTDGPPGTSSPVGGGR